MYIKDINEAGITVLTHEDQPELEVEHINLGNIITNYPVTYDEFGEIDWTPEYSVDVYADLALPAVIPPENEVDQVDSEYIWRYVHHYCGREMP